LWLLQALLIICYIHQKNVKRFVTALEEVEHDRTPKQTLLGRQLTDLKETLAVVKVATAIMQSSVPKYFIPAKP